MAPTSSEPLITLAAGTIIKGKSATYRIVGRLGGGGTGVVFRAENTATDQVVAVKFFLPVGHLQGERAQAPPLTQQRVFEEAQDLFRREVECLRHLRHPNIVPVLDTGEYRPAKGELAPFLGQPRHICFFTMTCVDGSDIGRYLAETPKLSKTQVLTTLTALCEAFVYLHETCGYLHADVKPNNVMVRRNSGEPVLIDFSLYKNLNFEEVDSGGITRLLGAPELFPAALPKDDPLRQAMTQGLTRDRIRELAFPTLDLFQLGKLLATLHPALSNILGTEEMDYLRLIEGELTDWSKARTRDARWLKSRIELLSPSSSYFMGVEELTPPSSAAQTLQLPDRSIAVSQLVTDLAGTRSFRRLRSINQLGFIDTIYPGAGYRRHLHSYHAYSCCVDLLGRLIHAPAFRIIFTPDLARQTLALALLHDINHCSLLHVFQEAALDKQTDLLDLFCDGDATDDSPSIYELVEKLGLTRQQFKDILFKPHSYLVTNNFPPGLQVAKSLIDSGADVDKMAYLTDDSLFTGAPYGRLVDIPRLLASATVAEVPTPPGGWHLAFNEGGLSAVESLVLARYWMFRTVYWHRANRAVMAMLLHVLRKLYVQGNARLEDFAKQTMWSSEESVLEYLEATYRSLYPHESKRGRDYTITRNILKSPNEIYSRLLTIQGGSADSSAAHAYEVLVGLEPSALEKYRLDLTAAFKKYMAGLRAEVTDDDILIDLPRRRLDLGGPIFITFETSEVRSLSEVPGPVERVSSDLDRLARRVRVFVRPELVEALGPETLGSRRPELMALATSALPSTGQMR